jgi:hypothetical protein
MVAGDLFKYMSALIKVSNHLALILPGESCPNHNASRILTPPTLAHMDTPEQVPCSFLLSFFSFNRLFMSDSTESRAR